MYNGECKQAYLDTLPRGSGLKNIRSYFEVVQESEEEKEKDIAEFSKEEIIEFYENSSYCNFSYIVERIFTLRNYRIWYNDNVDHCEISFLKHDLLKEIDVKKIIKRNMYNSFEHMLDVVESTPDVYDIRDVVLYILAWYQFKISDSVLIEKKDITFDGSEATICFNGETTVIKNERAVKILKHYHEMRSMNVQFLRNSAIYYQQNDVYYIRSFKKKPSDVAKPLTVSTIRQRTKDRARAMNVRLIDIDNVILSGEFVKMRESIQAGADIAEHIKSLYPTITPKRLSARIQFFEQYEQAMK